MGCTPLISLLCQLLLKPIFHKEKGRKQEEERKKYREGGCGGERHTQMESERGKDQRGDI